MDPATLETIGTIHTGSLTDWVASLPDGRTLLVALPKPPESQTCCAIYLLDLESAKLFPLIFPALHGVLSMNGHQLYAQRGNVGIDIVDLLTLRRGPAMGPLGRTYLLQPSSYRRWLFGVGYPSPPSLDMFDLKTNTLARSISIPGGQRLTGVWAGEKYYLLGYGKGKGTLWSVTPETQKLADGKPIDLHELGGDCRLPGSKATEPLMLQPPVAAGGRLVMYEGFGGKFDRRGCATPPSGGVYVIDPASGAVVAHLAPSLYFMRLVAGRNDTELFGIEVGPTLPKYSSRLVRLDPGSGKILASRELDGLMAVHLSLALLFDSVIPHGEVQAALGSTPSWMAACAVTKPLLDEPPRDPKASPFGLGEWYISESRAIWFPRQGWRAGTDNKVILIRPAGVRLAISGRRLDGPAPPLKLSDVVSEYPGSTFEVIAMTFPAEGCWEVTAKARNDELRFVTTVAPARKNARGGLAHSASPR
ncbi:MAG: hypothetical protein WBN92_05575 [Terriglobia bacterium]